MVEIEVYGLRAIGVIPISVYWIMLVALAIGSAAVIFTQKTRKAQKISLLLLVIWVILIYSSAVVFRESRDVSSINVLPLWSYFNFAENSYLWEMTTVNLLNVCMFVPIGLLLKFGFPKISWKQVLLVGIVLSLCIELSQYVFKKGLCEIDDVIHNVAGCMIGYGLMVVVKMLNIKGKR